MIEHDAGPVHDDLLRAGLIAPVALGGPEERAWLDCDLASFAEGRLGERLDPRELDEAHRAEWMARVLDERPMSLKGRSKFERCYWLLEAGQRAGTLGLANGTLGRGSLYVSSFYVLPPYRGQGVGRRAMGRLMEALTRHDLGLRLDTSWCWQRAVGFYVKLGLWVYMWKRDLTLSWDPATPPPRIEVGEETASLSVQRGDGHLVLAEARRRGDALELLEPPAALVEETGIGDAYWQAGSTLALALALHGWPLVRSPEEWESSYFADAGAPEALAYKITVWEAWARKRGWVVATPRIPGLDYPTWDDFEARWKADAWALGFADP